MKTLIVYAHPYEKSFNHAILETLKKRLKFNEIDFEVIDLYKDNFNPAYTKDELKLFSKGETNDPLVKNYQQKIKQSDRLIFIFPIWWNEAPAIIKGFIDKVFKYKFAYVDSKTGIKGQINNIKTIKIFTTSKSPSWYLKYVAGNYVNKILIKATFKQLGMKNCDWHNFGNIKNSTRENRKIYLNEITNI